MKAKEMLSWSEDEDDVDELADSDDDKKIELCLNIVASFESRFAFHSQKEKTLRIKFLDIPFLIGLSP